MVHRLMSTLSAGNKGNMALLLGFGIMLLNACGTVQKALVTRAEAHCGLIGPYCDKLTPGNDQQKGLRYVRPGVDWSQYDKVIIAPVTYWGSEEAKISQADRQALVNYFQQTLTEQFGKKFQVVDQAGPGAMTLTVGLTDAESATPVLRSISMIVPQARVLSSLKYVATGTFPSWVAPRWRPRWRIP